MFSLTNFQVARIKHYSQYFNQGVRTPCFNHVNVVNLTLADTVITCLGYMKNRCILPKKLLLSIQVDIYDRQHNMQTVAASDVCSLPC